MMWEEYRHTQYRCPLIVYWPEDEPLWESYVVFPSGIFDPDVEYVATLSDN
jgi:hypothetical protein